MEVAGAQQQDVPGRPLICTQINVANEWEGRHWLRRCTKRTDSPGRRANRWGEGRREETRERERERGGGRKKKKKREKKVDLPVAQLLAAHSLSITCSDLKVQFHQEEPGRKRKHVTGDRQVSDRAGGSARSSQWRGGSPGPREAEIEKKWTFPLGWESDCGWTPFFLLVHSFVFVFVLFFSASCVRSIVLFPLAGRFGSLKKSGRRGISSQPYSPCLSDGEEPPCARDLWLSSPARGAAMCGNEEFFWPLLVHSYHFTSVLSGCPANEIVNIMQRGKQSCCFFLSFYTSVLEKNAHNNI